MRTSVLVCLWAGLLAFASAEDIGYWRLGGVVVSLTNGTAMRGYFRWHVYHEPAVAESLPAVLRRQRRTSLELDTALVGVRYPDSMTVVTRAVPVIIPLESVASVAAVPGPLDGRQGHNTPLVSTYQAGLLQTKPFAVCSGVREDYTAVFWLSYSSQVGLADLKPLCSFPLIEFIHATSGSDLIQLEFVGE